ncbi:hypothetical protein L3Y34_007536 [Caenorhabditis briggsae]|uniref:glucuronosyltransferase n=1 Tax=Caenorhabditis briggsae TaxID=6238 RepID=A0AAE9A486_CAEBR|nr:hypothetical protein L3Y34_007536 [Caenorhabditis briggsae]
MARPVPSWKDLVTQSPTFITNSNPYLDFAVPTTATIVHAGGNSMDLEKMKHVGSLPEEYEKILQERESTVLKAVLKQDLSKCSNYFQMSHLSGSMKRMTLNSRRGFQKNVHLKKCVPQTNLLADKRVNVFMTHGELGSTMEVAYSAKSALMVSISGDQPKNALMLAVPYDKRGKIN